MKLGEIKVEALRLMFVDFANDYGIEELETIATDRNYAQYVSGMTGAINRCMSELEIRKVLPVKRKKLTGGNIEGRLIRYNLDEICADFYAINRVIRSYRNAYEANADYRMEGNTLVLNNVSNDEQVVLLYYPRLKRVTGGSDNNMELSDIPDFIATAIPYYIKGDLFRLDEPAEAGEARNWFEAALDDIIANQFTPNQTVVESKFRLE